MTSSAGCGGASQRYYPFIDLQKSSKSWKAVLPEYGAAQTKVYSFPDDQPK